MPMFDPIILFGAATGGAAATVCIFSALFWRVRAEPRLGYFTVVAGVHAVFAVMNLVRNTCADIAIMDGVLRVVGFLAAVYGVALLRLYRHLFAMPRSWWDRGLMTWLLVIGAGSLINPGGWSFSEVTGIHIREFGVWGRLAVAQGPPDPLGFLQSAGYMICVVRLGVLAWTQRAATTRTSSILLLLAPTVLAGAVVFGLGLTQGWWEGIPLGEYGMLTVFLLLCAELWQREASVHARIMERDIKISALLDHGLTFAGLLDARGTIVLANRSAVAMTGLPPEQVVGQSLAEGKWWPPAAQDRLHTAVIRAGEGISDRFLTTCQNADGHVLDIDFSLNPHRDHSGAVRYLIAEGRDVSDLRRFEARLREGRKMEALGQLAGGIAHDFNNTLAGIMGAAELALLHTRDPEVIRRLETVLSASGHAANLTRRLLSFARRAKVQNVPIELHRLLDETLELLRRTAGPGLRIERQWNAASDRIIGDPSELQAAFLNVGVNARDAMFGPGMGTESATAHARADNGTLRLTTALDHLDQARCDALDQAVAAGPYLRIEFSDNGCGMSEAVLTRIFEPFFTTKAEGQGTGLGMAAVLGTVRSHGGAVQVHSVVGTGTTMTVWLPVAPVASAASAESVKVDQATPLPVLSPGQGICIVVDDEAGPREHTGALLSALGFQVENFADPHLAQSRLGNLTGITCVMLDLAMPGMDGRTLYQALRAASPRLPIIISSGYMVGGQLDLSSPDAHLRLLPKPWRHAELVAVLQSLRVVSVML